jgi:hypothetical protein
MPQRGATDSSPTPTHRAVGRVRETGDSLLPDEDHTGDASVVRRRTIDNPSTIPSPARVRWMLAGSLLLFGSALVASVVRWLEPKPDQVIVIEREANAEVETLPPAEPTPTRALTTGNAHAPNEPTKTSAKSVPGQALNPEPGMLTSNFARQQPRVQRCFGAHAVASDSHGEIMIEFRVDSAGSVEKAELVPAKLGSSALGSCLIAVAKSTHFPRLTHGVTFRIPIQARVTEP